MIFRQRNVALGMCLIFLTRTSHAQWPQWGGPHRDFAVDGQGLADSWPSDGPKKLWSRNLGAGNSSIVVDDGRLYTMYRGGGDEIVVALNAADGKTIWERKYAAPLPKGMDATHSKGPHATPVISGDFIYTLGVGGQLHCLRKKDGGIVWAKNYLADAKGKIPLYGFASTPIVYKDRVLAAVGGKAAGVVAFDAKSGSILWKKYDFGEDGMGLYSSPIIINIAGEDQLIVVSGTDVNGLNPTSGDILWSYPHGNEGKINIPTPHWRSEGILYVTSGGECGIRALKLEKSDGKFKPKEVWTDPKAGTAIGNLARSGEFLYTSTNKTGMGPSFLAGVDLKNGKVLWSERGFSKANVLAPQGKLIILDEDGNLALAVPSPAKLEVKSKVSVLKKPAWTIPTLVGKTLYLRDNEVIMALDLGPAGK